jgi:hypothetical protein
MKSIKDFNDPHRKERVLNTMAQFNINESNADQTIDELMKRFI